MKTPVKKGNPFVDKEDRAEIARGKKPSTAEEMREHKPPKKKGK